MIGRHYYILGLLLFLSVSITAQLESVSTQYMHSQLMINPAYTGVRNSFSLTLMTRQQWMGVKGAPVNYNLTIHSPLNKSKVSIGGAINSYQAGPVQLNSLSLYYAYLVRLRHDMFLSMGVSAIAHHYGFDFNDINVIDEGDPNFNGEAQNIFKPNAGAGVFLYTPSFYLGVSVSRILSSKFCNGDTGQIISEINRLCYLSGGHGFSMNKEFYLKPSFMVRFVEKKSYSVDINTMLLYKELFSVGMSYRVNTAMAFVGGVRLSDHINVYYSYDLSTESSGIGKGSHEITLSFDSSSWLKRNRDRMFRKKKSDNDEEAGMRSIRYF